MWRQPYAAVGGLGLALLMWVLEVAGVKIPSRLLITLGVIAFGMVLFGAWPIVLRLRRFRHRVQLRNPIVVSPQGANNTFKSATQVHEGVRQPSEREMWIEELIEGDRSRLSERLRLCSVTWLWDGIAKHEPYVDAIIELVNASVFKIRVTGGVGSVTIGSEACSSPAQISSYVFSHGERGGIRIHQPITVRTAERLSQAKESDQEVEFSLQSCYLQVEAKEPGRSPLFAQPSVGYKQKLVPGQERA